ncbi:hypothetical protein IGI04_018618 [Brassica rapa subsp. trilocularis]|uniref:Uncharacterized protein n=1 Tax=Brassica rapa subsp. trilocularis TaxID=1813537 RepID=A0ABQ7MDG7_BRACM|nr:hypothetical protein IGI04_018618 [Brassica rapa subsp. trilocularis]
MSQEDDVDVTPLSHCQTDWLGAWGESFLLSSRSYLWAEKPIVTEMATKQLIVSPVTVSAKSLASLRVSSAKFGTLKPGTLKQSQFCSLVVKAASVVAPKYTSIKPLGDRILVKIKEAEEKTMGGILLPSTDWSTNHLLHRYAGTEVEFNDVKHLILKEDDIGLS